MAAVSAAVNAEAWGGRPLDSSGEPTGAGHLSSSSGRRVRCVTATHPALAFPRADSGTGGCGVCGSVWRG
jgi:hypothetical protein